MSVHINIPGATPLNLNLIPSDNDLDNEPSDDEPNIRPYPPFEGDMVLTTPESLRPQIFVASTEFIPLGTAFDVELHNGRDVESTSIAVATISGTLTSETITVTFQPAQLALLTNVNVHVRYVIPSLDYTRYLPLSTSLSQAPDAAIVPDDTVNSLRPTLYFTAIPRVDDIIQVTLNGVGYQATPNSNEENGYLFTVTEDLTDAQTYTLEVKLIGADDQETTATGTITVALADTATIVVTSPVDGFQTDGDSLTVSWVNPTPMYNRIYLDRGTPAQIAASTHTTTLITAADNLTSAVINDLPNDGGTTILKVIQIGDDGDGNPNWQDRREVIISGTSIPQPFISNPNEGATIPDPQVISFSTRGSASADFYNVKLMSRFNFESQYLLDNHPGVNAASQLLSNLPDDGSSVYLSIEGSTNGVVTRDVIHFVSGDSGGVSAPTFVTPAQLSNQPGTGMSVSWQLNGTVVDKYWFHVGTYAEGKDIYAVEITDGTTTSHTIPQGTLPNDNSVIYLDLSYQVSGQWYHINICVTNGTSATENRPVISAPSPGQIVQGSTFTANWADNGFTADSFTVTAGSTLDGTEFGNHTGIPTTTLSQQIAGYGSGSDSVYVSLLSVTSGVPKVHSRRRFYQQEVVQVGGHNLQQGVGIPTSVAGFETLNITQAIKLNNNEVLENKIIRPVDSGVNGYPAVYCAGKTGWTIRNCVIVCPASWATGSFNTEGKAIYVNGGHSGNIENVNTYYGKRANHIVNHPGLHITNLNSSRAYSHHLITKFAGPQGTRRTHYKNIAVNSDYYNIRSPGSSSMDNLNFYQPVRASNQAYDTLMENFYAHGGHGSSGSGAIVDGFDQIQNVAGGGVTMRDGVLLDTGLKAFGLTYGNRVRYYGMWGYQDTTSPTAKCNPNKAGGYCGDYTKTPDKYRVPWEGDGDHNFGDHEMHNCITHWQDVNGNVNAFNYEKINNNCYPHPLGFNDYKNNGNISDTNSTPNPTITRAESRARALQLTKDILIFDIPEAYNMDWANMPQNF